MQLRGLLLLSCLLAFITAQIVMIEPTKLVPGCSSDSDCLVGYTCMSSVCTDNCIMMKCTSGTICKDGLCNPICTLDSQCPSGLVCNGKYCVDKCRYIKCPANSQCVKGKCLDLVKECSTDRQCKKGFYCTVDGTCEDKCLLSNPCKKNEKCVAGKCIPIVIEEPVCPLLIDCTDPRPTEKECPTVVWKKQPAPVVCGINSDGKLVNYPLECYACKNSSIVSYYNTTCDKIPQSCVNQDLSVLPVCGPNEILVKGNCVPKPDKPDQILCTEPRPNDKTCPILQFFREPDPLVCGVDSLGNYIDFPVECYACKQKDIVFYYNTTCENVKKLSCLTVKCTENTTCVNGVCVPNPWPVCKENAKIIKCKKVRPNNKTCPVVQFLIKPENIVCGVTSTGEHISYPVECYACKNTEVVYYYNQSCEYLSAPCPVSTFCNLECKLGFRCINGKCVDACLGIFCIATTKCINGSCVPIDNPQV